MPKNNFVTELVNAFNLRNYYLDDVNTNFTVKGNKIVGLFASDVEIKKYFQEIKKEIIKRHYGTEEVAGKYYNLNYFPFVFDVNSKWKAKEKAIREVELGDSTNNEVIRNLKVHFANGFQRVVEVRIAGELERKARMTKEGAYKCIERSTQLERTDRHSPYLYCISFNDRYCKENGYPPRFFEAFRGMYISAFDLKLEEYGFNDSSIFYEQRDNKLYIKDITNINVVKGVAKHVREGIALDFKTPDKEDSKIENFKDVLSSLMPKRVRESISAYDYDIFTDEKKIQNGDSFVLIPLIKMDGGRFETLSSRDASKINRVLNNSISDIKGKTANPQYANCKEPVYAFSNKQIALLLPKIMESPITYNEISGSFEFAVDLENFKRCGSSRSSSTVASPFNSPTHAGPSGLRTPPNQRRSIDSGIGESPPKPKDSGSSSGGLGLLTKLSDMECEPSTHFQNCSVSGLPNGHLDEAQLTQLRSPTEKSQDEVLKEPPRQGLEEPFMSHGGTSKEFSPRTYISSATVISEPSSLLQSVDAAQNVQTETSASFQPIGFWSSQGTSRNKWQPLQFPGHEFSDSSWKGANPVGTKPWTQQTNPYLSQGTSGNKLQQPLQFPGPGPSGLLLPRGGPSSNAELRQRSQVSSSGPLSSRGANENMRTTWYVSSPLTTGNDPKSSSPEFFVRSPGVEDVNDVEPEKQQVTDNNHNKCSEAKPQESESPKKRMGSFSSKIIAFFSPSKSKHDASLNRCDVGRDTTRSVSATPVTEKPSVSRLFSSFSGKVRAENNSPSKETSPVTEACTKNKPGATELEDGGFSNKPRIQALACVYSTVKAQLPGERSSQASADSGLGKSLERGQSPLLIEEFNDKSLINSRVDSPKITKYRQEGKEVFV